jgi:hypothetical protein
MVLGTTYLHAAGRTRFRRRRRHVVLVDDRLAAAERRGVVEAIG